MIKIAFDFSKGLEMFHNTLNLLCQNNIKYRIITLLMLLYIKICYKEVRLEKRHILRLTRNSKVWASRLRK